MDSQPNKTGQTRRTPPLCTAVTSVSGESKVCGRLGTSSDGLCLFHSADDEKDLPTFRQSLHDELAAGETTFKGYVFPAGLDFPDQIIGNEAHSGESILFDDSVFRGDIDFGGTRFANDVSFAGTKFEGSVDFSEAEFIGTSRFAHAECFGDAIFSRAKFRQAARFANVRFLAKTDFEDVSFSSSVTMSDVTFSQDVRLSRSDIQGNLELTQLEFNLDADLSELGCAGTVGIRNVEFRSNTIATDCKFAQAVEFSNVSFLGRADFTGVAFSGLTLFRNVQFTGDAAFERCDLQRATFHDCDVSGASFGRALNLEKAEFDIQTTWAVWPPSGRRWAARFIARSRPAVADEVAARDGITEASARLEAIGEAERAYRALRLNFEARKDPERSGQFYFAEMEMRRLSSSTQAIPQRVGSMTALYGLLSGYGQRWLHALGWFVFVVFVTAWLYLFAGLWLKTAGVNQAGVSQTYLTYIGCEFSSAPDGTPFGCIDLYRHALLHSFLVATLLGKDTYAQPATTAGHVVQAAETVAGPLLAGLMALAIRRRYQR